MKKKKKSHNIKNARRKIEFANETGDFSIQIDGSVVDLTTEEVRMLFDDMASRIMIPLPSTRFIGNLPLCTIKVR